MKKFRSVIDNEINTNPTFDEEPLIRDLIPSEQDTIPSIDHVARPIISAFGDVAVAPLFLHDDLDAQAINDVDTPEKIKKSANLTKTDIAVGRALIENPGKPFSMVEFKEMIGIESLSTARYALYNFIEKAQSIVGHNVVAVTGKTKGTKYFIALEDVQQLIRLLENQQRKEVESNKKERTPPPEKNSRYESELTIRAEKVQKLVMSYKDHRIVKKTLQFANQTSQNPAENEKISPEHKYVSGKYEILTRADEQILFSDLNRMLDLIDALGGAKPSIVEELVLIQGVIAHELIFLSNMRLVVHFSKPYLNQGLDASDVIQEAGLGMRAAIARFDVGRNTKFSTYASDWIKQYASRAVDNMSRTIRVPVNKVNEIHRIAGSIQAQETIMGRALTDEEATELTGLSIQAIHALNDLNRPSYVYLDDPLGESGSSKYETVMQDTEPVEANAIRNESRSLLARILSRAAITDMQRMIIGLRTAIEPDMLPGLEVSLASGKTLNYAVIMARTETSSGRDLEEVGQILGLDRFRVRSLESRAMAEIKKTAVPQVRASE